MDLKIPKWAIAWLNPLYLGSSTCAFLCYCVSLGPVIFSHFFVSFLILLLILVTPARSFVFIFFGFIFLGSFWMIVDWAERKSKTRFGLWSRFIFGLIGVMLVPYLILGVFNLFA